jgi:uncharacterized membrane protein YeiH
LQHAFELPNFFQLGATFIWAVSGAGLGVRRGYDYTGVFVMAFVSSLGGGLIRDGIFLQHVPVAISDWVYLPTVLIGAIVGTVASIAAGGRKPARAYKMLLDTTDALGLGAYGCVGAQDTLQAGLSVPAAIFVGVVNAVGGGLLRSVLANEIWMLPGKLFALAALAGVALFCALVTLTPMHASTAAWIAIAVTFVIRVLALRYNWHTTALLPASEIQTND